MTLKEESTRLMVTVSKEIAEEIKAQAIEENRSISNMIQTILLDYFGEGGELVVNLEGKKIYFGAAINLMDDDIREELHMKIAPCSKQRFFEKYLEEHKKKHGEDFRVD